MNERVVVSGPVVIPAEFIDGRRLIEDLDRIEHSEEDLEPGKEFTLFWFLCGAIELLEDGSVRWDPGSTHSEMNYQDLFDTTNELGSYCTPGFVYEKEVLVADSTDPEPSPWNLYFAAREWWEQQDAQIKWLASVGVALDFEDEDFGELQLAGVKVA